MSDIPVHHPLLTDALVAKIHLANEETGQLERAFPTMFRHSDAGKCARAMAYSFTDVLNQEFAANDVSGNPAEVPVLRTDPVDLAGEWVMALGSLIHEAVQDALHDRFGSSCEVEVKVHHDDLSSGHIDAVISHVPGIGTIAYELKTKGGYGFDKAIGVDRRAYKQVLPEGPGTGAKIQGALNAVAVDADLLVIGVIGMEAISKQLAERINFNDLQRVMAEWHYQRSEFIGWAKHELDRMAIIRHEIDEGRLPERVAIGDEFELEALNPDASRPSWKCVYCPFRTRCSQDG